MKKTKSTKRSLLMSALALLMCFSMLIGSTYAWFTDSVTSGNNIIKSGNLDVELEYKKVVNNVLTDWDDVAGKDELFDKNALWEPGHTEVVFLKVSNVGTLDLKYQLGVNIVKEEGSTNVYDDEFKLSDYLVFKVLTSDSEFDYTKYDTREEVVAAAGVERGLKDYNGTTTALADGEVDYLALLVYMPTDVDNKANYKKGFDAPYIELGVNLYATQVEAESDSFGNDYDKDAWADGMKVYNANDLQAAINNGETNITLAADIELDEPIVIPAAPTTYSLRNATPAVVINLNGKTITTAYNESTGKHAYAIDNYGSLVINGGTIKARGIYNREDATLTVNETEIVNLDMNGGSCIWSYGGEVYINNATLIGYTGCVYSEGYLEINGGTYTCYSAVTDDGVQISPTYNIRSTGELVINGGDFTSRHGLLAIKGSAEINGGTYTMTSIGVITSHVFYVYGDSSNVVVNDGTFNCDLRTAQNNGSSMICVNAANVTVNVYGGTFNLTPEKYVAGGYEVTNNGDGTWTVDEYKVSTSAELVDAIANGKAVELTQDINLSKIDLTGVINNDVVIDANGHKITTTEAYGIEVTAGKNVTISNADVEMTKAGDYITYAAGFKIANGDYAGATITLENCTITMANTDWAYAVNMPASVKNLNLVIDNCTLEGAIAVQCWGDNNNITITNSELICNYTTSALYTSYCVVLQSDGTSVSENNTLVIDNCEFKYSGVDNFNSPIYSVDDLGTGNTVTVTNCTYGEKVVAK